MGTLDDASSHVTNEGWPTRAGREGDSQPMPITHSDAPDIQSLVIEDIQDRRALGIQRYGTPLQAHNGRDALQDAYEEALDLAMYLKQRIVEDHDGRMDWLVAHNEVLEILIRDMSPIHHKHLLDLAVEMTNRKVAGEDIEAEVRPGPRPNPQA